MIDGKAATFSDLKANMHVTLQMSVLKEGPVVAVTAQGTKVAGIVKIVNPERKTISVHIPSVQMTTEGVPVAMDAKVLIAGREAMLSDLKTGMLVTLQMCAEIDRSEVVGISTQETAKE
jgi:hypothetical protein